MVAFRLINREKIRIEKKITEKLDEYKKSQGCCGSRPEDGRHYQIQPPPAPADSMGNFLSSSRQHPISVQPTKPKSEIEKLEERILTLEKGVKSYNSVHFCLEYRTLEEEGAQLQLALDKLDIPQGSDWKERRRQGVIRTENIVTNLSLKVHREGKCDECS